MVILKEGSMINNSRKKRENILNFKVGDMIGEFSIMSSTGSNRNKTRAEPLGDGGSGIVYKVSQILFDKVSVERAMKLFIYRKDIAKLHSESGPISESHFEQEIANLSTINHENVTRVIKAGIYAIDQEYRIPYIVSEYVEGPSLSDVISSPVDYLDNICPNEDVALNLVEQLYTGLSHLHSLDFYHCDIAPKNIFLTKESHRTKLIIGDLGIGFTKDRNMKRVETQILVRCTRLYSPRKVEKLFGNYLPLYEFCDLQPEWDIYGAGKTVVEFIDVFAEKNGKSHWLDVLRGFIINTFEHPKDRPLKEILEYVGRLQPNNRGFPQVPEITHHNHNFSRWPIPITSVKVSERISWVANHPEFLRLQNVKQLFMATPIFPAAVHNRYEHSLGVYENMRRYIQILANHKEFLEHCTPKHIELALVSALLSSISKYPYSIIIKEIRQFDKTKFSQFTTRNVLEKIFSDERGDYACLFKHISKQFTSIHKEDLYTLLSNRGNESPDKGIRIIQSLLDSSLGVRVIDYLRRDSLYAGMMPHNGSFDIDDLLQHIYFDNDRIGIKNSGVSVAEEVIILRFNLFKKVYWNWPSRSYQTMLRYMLITLLEEVEDFESNFFSMILNSNETEILGFFSETARVAKLFKIENIAKLLELPRPSAFKQVLELNRIEDDARKIDLWHKIKRMNLHERQDLQNRLDQWFCKRYGYHERITHLLIDMPEVPYPIKMGEDINVKSYKGIVPLVQASGFVSETQNKIEDELQRFRVFMHPVDWETLKKNNESASDAIYNAMVKSV
jgi:uncharacterized protein